MAAASATTIAIYVCNVAIIWGPSKIVTWILKNAKHNRNFHTDKLFLVTDFEGPFALEPITAISLFTL